MTNNHKKWKSPLDLMIENIDTEEKIESFIKEIPDSQLKKITHNDITIWRYKDRNIDNISDIQSLVSSIQNEGQQQPCIVRKDNNSEMYELIVGYRRYAACKMLNIPILCIVTQLSDKDAALCQIAENKYRKDISDFEKGNNYTKLLDAGILKKVDLTKTLNITKQSLDRYLSFNKIPTSIIESITNIHTVSARTAEEVLRLSKLGEDYVKKLKSIGEDISNKKLGAYSINKIMNKLLGVKSDSEKSVYSKNNKLLFTINTKKDGSVTIQFKKEMKNKINLKNIKDAIYNEIISK